MATAYNTDHISRAYSYGDLALMSIKTSDAMSALRECLEHMNRIDGTLYRKLCAMHDELVDFNFAIDCASGDKAFRDLMESWED